MNYLIDTNVVSEFRKGVRADAGVRRWFETVVEEEIFLSVLTIGELRRGIAAAFAERILDVTAPVAEEWGRMNVPDPLPVIDGLLAATAKIRGLSVVTRNTRHIARAGVSCINPFAA